ncbi:MAG: hypothetical protein U5K84_14505 [Alkalibacterium sp.]|nr:hypothetical protein [Alkalibacterium sp.]
MNSDRKQIIVVSSGAYKFAPMKKPFFKTKRFNAFAWVWAVKLGTLYLAQELHEFYSRKIIPDHRRSSRYGFDEYRKK